MSAPAQKTHSRRSEPLTDARFEQDLEALRPGLIAFIASARPCAPEDAEDLLHDAVLVALKHIADYDPVTGRTGLLRWMKQLASVIILRDRRKTARQPDAVPLVYALPIPSRPPDLLAEAIWSSLRILPPEQFVIVADYLEGYPQQDIARRNRIHRNTVKNRLDLAAETLRCTFPSFSHFLDMRLFNECAHHARYVRQNDMAKYWKNHHPRELRWAGEWEPEEVGVRPELLRDLTCPDPFLTGARRRTDALANRKGRGA